ncbi:amphiphysin isoform X2 [Oratosquilla oratoria]|uniref:amphiphysin isoform X2 n=1 Tax=Oratosquilla oratoria TaxID=337810 RepID=UPI003F76D346
MIANHDETEIETFEVDDDALPPLNDSPLPSPSQTMSPNAGDASTTPTLGGSTSSVQPAGSSPCPSPSPSDPTTPTSPTATNGQDNAGSGGRKMPHLQLKKQYSKIFRIKTKILQNLGKADKTTDEIFDDYEVNFNKQQNNANRLLKEIANYLRCARALHGASKGLFEALNEVYEPEWVGHDLIYAQAQNSDMLWTDFCHKLQDQTLSPLTSYAQQFPEIRKKIDKRGRKLVDYDSQRHQLENLQRSARRDEYKIARVQDQLEAARTTYEALNKELYEELPGLYDERIPNVASHLQTLFAAKTTFMQESSKISSELEAIAEKLGKECARGTYKIKRGVPSAPRPVSMIAPSSPKTPTTPNSPSVWYDGGDNEGVTNEQKEVVGETGSDQEEATTTPKESLSGGTPPPPTNPPPDTPGSPAIENDNNATSHSDDDNRPTISAPVTPAKEDQGRPYEEIEFEDKKVNGSAPGSPARTNGTVVGTVVPPVTGVAVEGAGGDESYEIVDPGIVQNGPTFSSPLKDINKKVEEIYDIPVESTHTGATTEGLPSGVLYRVRATYKYTREDVDELSFEVGEIINVVEYDDPEEQEEGWLCGYKETTSVNEKGLFPANFTRPI